MAKNNITGFQSNATQYQEPMFDLNRHVGLALHHIYVFNVVNDYPDLGIYQGDRLVIDRAKKPHGGSVVLGVPKRKNNFCV